jgi:hypothetical protein
MQPSLPIMSTIYNTQMYRLAALRLGVPDDALRLARHRPRQHICTGHCCCSAPTSTRHANTSVLQRSELERVPLAMPARMLKVC